MDLKDLIYRNLAPKPWDEGEKIPWDEPGFSQRMLREHLSQAHDLASRRFDLIDRHVTWINQRMLEGQPSAILDLGCGPGLYANRLVKLGHSCKGIDFSPASISYAKETAEKEGLPTIFELDDIRNATYGDQYDLIMLIYGEFNTFKPEDANTILRKAYSALNPGGKLLLEVSVCDAIYDLGHRDATWYSVSAGLFSDRPYICLEEAFYNIDQVAVTERYWVIDAATNQLSKYINTLKGYTHAEFGNILGEVGFQNIKFYPSFDSQNEENGDKFILIVGEK